jgi:hypothetical protein
VKEAACRELLASLLRETFRMQVYRDHFEWLHPLCELHVKPALTALYTQLKQDKQGDKDAVQQLRKQVKNLVAEAATDACGSCTREHLARRVLMTQQLQQMAAHLQVLAPHHGGGALHVTSAMPLKDACCQLQWQAAADPRSRGCCNGPSHALRAVGMLRAVAASAVRAHASGRLPVLSCPHRQLPVVPQDDQELLSQQLPTVFAGVAYASSEVAWYFQHVNEQLPRGFPAQGHAQPLREAEPDFSVVQLLGALHEVYQILVGAVAAALCSA